MVLASLTLHSFLEYKIIYLLHPLKMKSMFWLGQISSVAPDGDVESSPCKSLSEIPPADMYFHVYTHTHAELCFSGFIFYNMMRLVRLVEKKKYKNPFPKVLNSWEPTKENSQTRTYHTF